MRFGHLSAQFSVCGCFGFLARLKALPLGLFLCLFYCRCVALCLFMI